MLHKWLSARDSASKFGAEGVIFDEGKFDGCLKREILCSFLPPIVVHKLGILSSSDI